MKNFPDKAALVAGVLMMASVAMLQPSAAETNRLPTLLDKTVPVVQAIPGVKLDVGANAEFEEAAEVTVKHDPLATAMPGTGASPAVTRMAYISLKGLPGETAVMTCGIENTAGPRMRTRDCSGAEQIAGHAIMGGHSMDSGILLTTDLLPNPQGTPDSSIAIDVSYL